MGRCSPRNGTPGSLHSRRVSAIGHLFFCQTMRLTKSLTNPELKCGMSPLDISLRFALSKKKKIDAGVAVSHCQNLKVHLELLTTQYFSLAAESRGKVLAGSLIAGGGGIR